MSVLKTPYEISLWEDRLTFVDENGNEYENSMPEGIAVKTSYLKEIKLCIIGANYFSAPINVYDPYLVRNINGSKTLTFSIYAKYYDELTDSLIDNPFVPLLINERKVKLKTIIKGKTVWFDFLIKNASENTENYSFTYTANDLFVNELSKTGFNLEFSEELENNQGTIEELASKVIQGTDWQIGEDTEIIQQFQTEALYEITLKKNINAKNVLTDELKTIKRGEKIYSFYSSVINNNYDFFQFIYNDDGNYLVDNDRIISNGISYYLSYDNQEQLSNIIQDIKYTNKYRGKRIVRTQEAHYDGILDKYVLVYEDKNKREVYGYTESEYISKELARTYITNGQRFVSNSGWSQNSRQKVVVESVPSFSLVSSTYIDRQSTLKYEQTYNNFLFNSGINDNSANIKEIAIGEEFVFRIKCGLLNEDQISLSSPENVRFKIVVKTYQKNEKGDFLPDNRDTKYFFMGITDASDKKDPDGYFITRQPLKNLQAISEDSLKKEKIGIFITIHNNFGEIAENTYYIQDVQFFKYILDGNNNLCLPDGSVLNSNSSDGEIIDQSLLSYTRTKYYYYYPEDVISKENVEYIHIGKQSEDFIPKYKKNFEKIRGITTSESNRFNILQELSEIFECWCKIEVKHKETGEILLGKDCWENKTVEGGTAAKVINDAKTYMAGNSSTLENLAIDSGNAYSEYQQQKFISFHNNIGQTNEAGFIYGINLKSIERTVESEEIVSKLIVKSNSNEHAKYGSCNISRSKENPSGENFILNFDYYINQGLLDSQNLHNDLYSLNSNWLGYYVNLKNINKQIEELSSDYSIISLSYTKLNAEYQTLKAQYEAGIDQLRETEEYFYELTQYEYDKIDPNNDWMEDKNVIALCVTISKLRIENKKLKEEEKKLKEDLEETKQLLENLDNQINLKIEEKNKLNLTFEKKYNRFIQEGSWTSEDYVDDDLYYLDAETTLFSSSQPKIEYSINVVEISQIKEFENYSFELGDITYIQDTDFFGWTYINNVKTPYKEKVVITEITTYFDSPDKNVIKIQNYRTQFEDLFQRLTATAQQVEYRSGAYERAAGVVDDDGSIVSSALSEALSNSTNPFQNSNNQSVAWNEQGIVTKNLNNPAEILKVTSGGIFLTDDGGNTWITGITGKGINAKTITTGQLNTKTITIVNGDEMSFRWDASGISAYYKNENGKYNNKTFVRFDQYGIYGIRDSVDTFEPTKEQDIWDKANFALTWKGFMLRSNSGYGSISIDTEKDFNVYDLNNNELVRIGRLDDKGTYGIRISNSEGSEAFRATQNGLITGGWTVEPGGLYSSNIRNDTNYEVGLFSKELTAPIKILDSEEKTDWRIIVNNKFGVDFDGNLYASNANITGTINATSGIIGGINITDQGLVVPSNRVDGIEIKDESDNNLFLAYKPGKTVTIGPWWVSSVGLNFENIIIGNTGISVGDKFASWDSIVTKALS